MDIKFENRYYATKEMLSEYVHKVLYKKIKIKGSIFAVISFIMFWVTLLDDQYILSALFGFCSFMILAVIVISPKQSVKQAEESNTRLHNGKNVETVILFGDNISFTEGPLSLVIEYSQIQKIYSLKHSYVLMLGKNNAIMVKPSNFTIGTFEEFRKYIELKTGVAEY